MPQTDLANSGFNSRLMAPLWPISSRAMKSLFDRLIGHYTVQQRPVEIALTIIIVQMNIAHTGSCLADEGRTDLDVSCVENPFHYSSHCKCDLRFSAAELTFQRITPTSEKAGTGTD